MFDEDDFGPLFRPFLRPELAFLLLSMYEGNEQFVRQFIYR